MLRDQCLNAFKVLPKSVNIIQNKVLKENGEGGDVDKVNLEFLKFEIMNNMNNYSKTVGTPVNVGASIELQHLLTNKYLGVQLEVSAKSNNEYLKFVLKDSPDDTCAIRVESVFNFQKERVQILNGDKVYFEIWISRLHSPVFLHKFKNKACASFEQKSKISLILLCSMPESNQNQIFSWNYVYIKDSENNMSLSVSDENEVVFTKDQQFHSCLWRIESDQPSGIVPGGSYKIKRISNKEYLTVKIGDARKLSLFNSITDLKKQTNSYMIGLVSADDLHVDDLFTDWVITPINNMGSKFIKSQYCKLMNEFSKLFISMNYLQLEKCYPRLDEKETDDIFFKIFKCNEEISTDVSYANELICRLDEAISLIESNDVLKSIKTLTKILKILKDYLMNNNFCLASGSGQVGQVSKSRQDILHSQGIFSVTCRLLSTLHSQNLDPYTPAIKKIFNLLVLLCIENSQNKLEVIKMSETLSAFINLSLKISEYLTSILKDFKEGHQKYPNEIEILIKEHIKLIKTTTNQEYIKFLSTVSVCGGEGMASIQDLIIKSLLLDDSIFKIPVIENKSIIFYYNQAFALEDCFEDGNLVKNINEIENFYIFLQLMSHLCDGRNYECINRASEWFPFAVLFEYINNKRISSTVQSLFLTLIGKVYIDISPNYLKEIPEFVAYYEFNAEVVVYVPSNKVSPLVSIRSLDSISLMNYVATPYVNNNADMEALRTYILNYFDTELNINEGVTEILLNIMKLVNLMTRLDLINNSAFKYTDGKGIMNYIVDKLCELLNNSILDPAEVKNYKHFYSNIKKVETNFDFLRNQNLKKTTISNYSNRIIGFLRKSKKSKPNDKTIAEGCIVEILKNFSFYLDWRLNKILKKIFASHSLLKNSKLCLKSIPPVLRKGGKKSSFSIFSEEILVKLLDILIRASSIEVKSLALSILVRSCFVVKETVENIAKVQYLKEKEDIEVHKYFKSQKTAFIEIVEKSEIWLEDEDDSTFNTFSAMLRNFSDLLLKNSVIVEKTVIYDDESPCMLRQNMFFHLKYHTFLLKFISENNFYLNDKPKVQILFRLIFKLLTRTIIRNKTSQDYFKKYLKSFMLNLELDLGQIETLCELYRDNYELCNNLDPNILNIFVDAIKSYGRQARFLKFFQVVQVVNNEALFDNQLKIMNYLLDRKSYRHLCYCKGDKEVKFVFDQEMEFDEPVLYHAELFKVLSLSTVGVVDVGINESKCKKIMPIDKLFSLLEEADTIKFFNPLSVPLMQMLYDVYLDSETRLPHTVYSKELLKLVVRNREYLNNLSKEHLTLIVKILKKYSDIYSLKANSGDDLSKESSLFLDEVYRSRHLFDGFRETELSSNLYSLFAIYQKDFSISEEPSSEYEKQEQNDALLLKISIKMDSEYKLILKKEKSTMANIIKAGNNSGFLLQYILSELLQMIKYHKQRKISKRTVLLSILITKSLIIDPNTSEECRKELENLNGHSLILHILSKKDTESKIFHKLLIILIKLLKKGTHDSQILFFNHFINHQDSEHLFKILSDTLTRFCVSDKSVNELSFKPVCRVLEFLRLLCENHNTLLQNYLRVQEKSLRSYNFINSILVLLKHLIDTKDTMAFETVEFCFDTLTEMCQGPCKENQKAVIDSNFIIIVNNLLEIDESKENLLPYQSYQHNKSSNLKKEGMFKDWMVINLKYKSLITLHSMLEGNEDKYIISKMIRTINIENLNKNLIVYHKDWIKQKKKLNLSQRVFAAELGTLIYHLLRVFQDNPTKENLNVVKDLLPELNFNKDDKSYLSKEIDTDDKTLNIEHEIIAEASKIIPLLHDDETQEKSEFIEAVRYFEKSTGNIDIVLPGDILCKFYFKLDKKCEFLSNEMKFDFHFNADRSSDKSKLEYMLSRVEDISDHINNEFQVNKLILKFRIINIASKIIIWKILAFLNAILLFGLTLEYYNEADAKSLTLTKITYRPHNEAFYACEVIHLISSIMILIFYYLKNVPVLYKRGFRKILPLFKDDKEISLLNKGEQTLGFFSCILIRLLQVFYLYTNLETLYINCYLIFSILGCFYHVFFFAFHLLDFLYLFPGLQSVVLSVIQPWKPIVLVFIFILIVMYILTFFSYIYYYTFFDGNCESLMLCTYVSVIEGIKNTGGIGYYTYWNIPYEGQLRFWLFIYDNINNIILFIILWNILTGIIINAFSVIRGEKESNVNDQKTKCFICGMDKDEIEEITQKTFKYHKKYEHNEWFYVFFIIYLNNKLPSEYSGIESLIKKEVDRNSISWIPQGRGFSLTNLKS